MSILRYCNQRLKSLSFTIYTIIQGANRSLLLYTIFTVLVLVLVRTVSSYPHILILISSLRHVNVNVTVPGNVCHAFAYSPYQLTRQFVQYNYILWSLTAKQGLVMNIQYCIYCISLIDSFFYIYSVIQLDICLCMLIY